MPSATTSAGTVLRLPAAFTGPPIEAPVFMATRLDAELELTTVELAHGHLVHFARITEQREFYGAVAIRTLCGLVRRDMPRGYDWRDTWTYANPCDVVDCERCLAAPLPEEAAHV